MKSFSNIAIQGIKTQKWSLKLAAFWPGKKNVTGDSKAGATFEIRGKKFRDEKKMVEKLDASYLWGVAVGSLLAILVLTHPKYISPGVIDENRPKKGMAVFGLIIVGVSLIIFLTSPKKSYVDHKENIEFNKKLNQQIEEMKKEIMIKMELANS